MTENTYLAARRSQIHHYKATALFKKNADGQFVLYKSENKTIDTQRFKEERYPQLYIDKGNQETAVQELQEQLKLKLVESIRSGELRTIKSALMDIVEESFGAQGDANLPFLPKTIEIIYNEYANAASNLKRIANIEFGGRSLTEHSVNVMIFTLNYCIFCKLGEKLAKQLSLGALIHDIGLTMIPSKILNLNRQLTDLEFDIYKKHPLLGYDILKDNQDFDPSVAACALEHHERLDGEGFPRGMTNLTFEGRLIGLIDSFDHLISSERENRNLKNPFGAMSLIKREVLNEGRFDKAIFKNLCLSLAEKDHVN